MLRHSQDTTDTTSNAANYTSTSYSGLTKCLLTPDSVIASPFTAEEIAQAIAEIESEKALRQSSQTSAAQIASVLEHLNLDMAPSDVAAKIEKQRRARVQTGKAHSRRRSLFVALAAGLSCISIGGLLLRVNRASAPAQESTTVATVAQEGTTVVAVDSAEKVAIATAQTAAMNRERAEREMRRAQIIQQEMRQAQTAVLKARVAQELAEQARVKAAQSR